LEVYEQLDDPVGQAECLKTLAWTLHGDHQLGAAEEAVSRAIDLLPEKGNQLLVCQCHRVLGSIYRSKGKTEKSIHHYETALGIASSFDWHDQLFWIRRSLAGLFFDQDRFDDANAHLRHARSLAINNPYNLARAMQLQARIWDEQCKFEQAKSEALRAAEVFEKHGAVRDLRRCRQFLERIDSKRT